MDKIRSSICLSCCFRGSDVDHLALEHHHHHRLNNDDSNRGSTSFIRSPSSTMRSSKTNELPKGGKCRGFMSRIGTKHHCRRHSSDFRYDPLSYSLNFDEGSEFDDSSEISPAEYRFRNFSARLPVSPPPDPRPPASPSPSPSPSLAKEAVFL